MKVEIMNWNVQLSKSDWPIHKVKYIGDYGQDYIAINAADDYIQEEMKYDIEVNRWVYLGNSVWQCDIPDGWIIRVVGRPITIGGDYDSYCVVNGVE